MWVVDFLSLVRNWWGVWMRGWGVESWARWLKGDTSCAFYG